MTEKKKSLFDKAIAALTNRDEDEEAAKPTRAGNEATAKLSGSRGAMRREAAEKALGEKPVTLDLGAKTVSEQASGMLAAEKTTAAMAAGAPVRGVVKVRSLRIREDHNTSASVVGGLVKDEEVTILETWSDGKNTWARLDKGWSAMVYNGETYIALSPGSSKT